MRMFNYWKANSYLQRIAEDLDDAITKLYQNYTTDNRLIVADLVNELLTESHCDFVPFNRVGFFADKIDKDYTYLTNENKMSKVAKYICKKCGIKPIYIGGIEAAGQFIHVSSGSRRSEEGYTFGYV